MRTRVAVPHPASRRAPKSPLTTPSSLMHRYLLRLKPTSFWWPTVQPMWSCWCLRGCQDRHTTTHPPGGTTAPPPLCASASTSKRRSFYSRVLLCTHAPKKTNWHVGAFHLEQTWIMLLVQGHFDWMRNLFGASHFKSPACSCCKPLLLFPCQLFVSSIRSQQCLHPVKRCMIWLL